jgi:hypothetical protein
MWRRALRRAGRGINLSKYIAALQSARVTARWASRLSLHPNDPSTRMPAGSCDHEIPRKGNIARENNTI